MVFNFHHLKVDYRDGDKWKLMEPDLERLKRLFVDWQEGCRRRAAGTRCSGATTTSPGRCRGSAMTNALLEGIGEDAGHGDPSHARHPYIYQGRSWE